MDAGGGLEFLSMYLTYPQYDDDPLALHPKAQRVTAKLLYNL
jgi:hypothetical protein